LPLRPRHGFPPEPHGTADNRCKKAGREGDRDAETKGAACLSFSDHIGERLNLKILEAALPHLRFFSITAAKSDPNPSAILSTLFLLVS
jgi:hypothetical protein